MKLNLTTKNVKCEEIKIKCDFKREQIKDLEINFDMNYTGFYGYNFNDDSEKEIIEKYFNIAYIGKDKNIYYSYKSLRHIKLLILRKDELSKILEKIIKNSFTADPQDVLSWKLSEELAKEIDRGIMKSLISMNSGTTLINNLVPFAIK